MPKQQKKPKRRSPQKPKTVFPTNDLWDLLKKILEKTVVTIFWENVDRLERKAKFSLQVGLQFLIGFIAVFTGLVFLLVGAGKMIDLFLGIGEGVGFLFVGMFAVFAGVWIIEKNKKNKEEKF